MGSELKGKDHGSINFFIFKIARDLGHFWLGTPATECSLTKF